MEKEKINITLTEGVSEVIIREGEAVKLLDPKPPICPHITGTIGVPFEYLKKRVNTGQFTQERSYLNVIREFIFLELIINEHDEYERGEISGKLDYHPSFVEFGINRGKIWTPTELGMFFKMNRAFFKDKKINMKLVSDLMNFTATVNKKVEQSVKESGDRTDNYVQVVNSNLPEKFTLSMPIFKGMPPEEIEVETFVNIDGRSVSFVLLSPGAKQIMEEIRDTVIDEQLAKIVEIAPDLAIIEM